MTGCSRAGCTAPAVLQWLRQGTDAEAAAYSVRTLGMQQTIADNQRVTAMLNVAQLEQAVATLEARTEGVTPGMVQLVRAQLADARDAFAAIADPVPHPVEPVLVAVFGCEAHAVDPESATRIHDADCSVCACTDLAPVAPSVDVP